MVSLPIILNIGSIILFPLHQLLLRNPADMSGVWLLAALLHYLNFFRHHYSAMVFLDKKRASESLQTQSSLFDMLGFEVLEVNDETKDRKSDYENSDDERRISKIGSLKKKAINASNKLTHSLKKRGRRKVDFKVSSISIEDVRDAREESTVCELRQNLLDRDLLPVRHDDYHTLLR